MLRRLPALLAAVTLTSLCLPALAQPIQDRVEPRPRETTLQELKRDPATAALLSLLYPGAGQFYVGNNPQRSLYILGGGTLILGGSLVGYGILADRPAESVALGNLMITGVLLGFHLWNVRDAYEQAYEHNMEMEKASLFSQQPLLSPSPLLSHRSSPLASPLVSWSTQF